MEVTLQGTLKNASASDFLGSWINGNLVARCLLLAELKTSDFLGSWINGNYSALSTSFMPANTSDFLGSWINGNNPKPHTEYLHYQLLTSSEVELMETHHHWWKTKRGHLLTSSEVELMETVLDHSVKLKLSTASDFLGSWINGNSVGAASGSTNAPLLTSSEVELMETMYPAAVALF